MCSHPAEDFEPKEGKRKSGTSEIQSFSEAIPWGSILFCDTRDFFRSFKGGRSDVWRRQSLPISTPPLPGLFFPYFLFLRSPLRETSLLMRMLPFSHFKFRRSGVVSCSLPVLNCLVLVRFSLFLRFGGKDRVAIFLANIGRAYLWAEEGPAKCWDGREAECAVST